MIFFGSSADVMVLCRQDAKNNDELDKKDGLMEENVRKALDAYSPPCLRPLDLGLEGTSSTKPFLSPT